MSDKNKIVLKDRGWSQMAAILDKEIPQKKRSRKLVMWFFIAGIIALGIAYATNTERGTFDQPMNESIAQLNTSVNQGTDQNIPLAKDQSLNDVNSNEAVNALNSNLTRETNGEVTTTLVTQKNAAAIQNEKVEGRTIVVKDEEKEDSQIQEKVAATEIDSGKLNDKSASPDYDDQALTSAEGSDGMKLSKVRTNTIDPTVDNALRDQYTFNTLPEIKRFIISNNGQIDALLKLSVRPDVLLIEPMEKEKEKNYYAFTGANIGVNQKGIGYQLGVGRRFGSENIAFFAEGGYSQMNYKNNLSDLESIFVDFAAEIIPSGGFEITESTVLQEAVTLSQNNNTAVINNLSALFFTVGLEKKVFAKTYITGGLSYSRFLEVENPAVNFTSSDGRFQSDLNQYNVSKTTLFNNGGFKKYDLSTSLGARYNLSHRFTASVHYRIGLKNLLSSSFLISEISQNAALEVIQPTTSIYRKNVELRIDYNF